MISIYYSNYKSFLDIHVESVLEYCDRRSTRKFKRVNLDILVQRYFSGIVADFESLLRADPTVLARVKAAYDGFNGATQTIIKRDFRVTTLYGYFGNDGFLHPRTGERYGSRFLAEKLDIFTCPYCNENFVYSFNYVKGGNVLRRTFDWDHIYSQNDYPFLAVSFYNLTPSCKVCNQIKLDQNLPYFNPHTAIDVNAVYFYYLNPLGAGFITDSNKIEIHIMYKLVNYKAEIKNNIETVGLLSRMRKHKETVKDVLNRQRIYPSPYLRSINSQLLRLGAFTPSQARSALYGIYFSHDQYYKRPFSKLTDDILKRSL